MLVAYHKVSLLNQFWWIAFRCNRMKYNFFSSCLLRACCWFVGKLELAEEVVCLHTIYIVRVHSEKKEGESQALSKRRGSGARAAFVTRRHSVNTLMSPHPHPAAEDADSLSVDVYGNGLQVVQIVQRRHRIRQLSERTAQRKDVCFPHFAILRSFASNGQRKKKTRRRKRRHNLTKNVQPASVSQLVSIYSHSANRAWNLPM